MQSSAAKKRKPRKQNPSDSRYQVDDFCFDSFAEILEKPELWGTPTRDFSVVSSIADILRSAIEDPDNINMARSVVVKWGRCFSKEQQLSLVQEGIWRACASHDFSFPRKFISSVFVRTKWACAHEKKLLEKSEDSELLKQGRIRSLIDHESVQEGIAEPPVNLMPSDRAALADALSDAMQDLPPNLQEAFYQHYACGVSLGKIARCCKITKKRLAFLLKKAAMKLSLNEELREYIPLTATQS